MRKLPFVSIVIPCTSTNDCSRECVSRCKELDYANYEIILLPDEAPEESDGIKIVPTGPVTPGAKRNIGISNSIGEICAFIDSDAYPRKDWLKNAVKYFEDSDVAAVGGPGLTPEEDSFMQKASGFVLSSFMVGNLSRRYKSDCFVESDDIHSCNFTARKSVLLETGGWNERYWPGEDTLICREMRRLGGKLIEAPDVIVFHHRRPLFKEHLKQVSSYGLHRGYFAKKFKGNSLRSLYFLPSFLVTFLFAGGVLSFFNSLTFSGFLSLMIVYTILCIVASLFEVKGSKLALVVLLGTFLTHISYGFSFIIGLVKRDLQR